jgi:hypothetical protein
MAMNINAGGLTLNGRTEPILVGYVSDDFFTAPCVRPFFGLCYAKILSSGFQPNATLLHLIAGLRRLSCIS